MNRLLATASLVAVLSLAACSGSPVTPGGDGGEATTQGGSAGAPSSVESYVEVTTPAPDHEGDPVPVFIGLLEIAGVDRGTATDDQLTAEGHRACGAFGEGQSLDQVVAARSDTELAGMSEDSYRKLAAAAAEALCPDQQERISKEFLQDS